ncbi:MAG: hypothetical protein M3Z33_10110 [Actinomycetota bacterium]|nr:hypothetical protein [Actinomycetota bacterium]
MSALHVVLGVAMTVLFLAAGVLGGWRWYRVSSSEWFWRLLRAAQAAMVAETAIGGLLLAFGRHPGSDLHYVYGLLPIAISFAAEQLRISAAETVLESRGLESARAVGELPDADQRSVVLAIVRREIGVMALAALVIVGLALRAEFGMGGL